MAMIEPPKKEPPRSQKSGYPFNIVNMAAFKGKEEECKKLDEHVVVIPEYKVVREMDIISNNYYKDHELRFKKECDAVTDQKISELEKKRILNVITMKYYDSLKESESLLKDAETKKRKQDQQEAMFPEEYKFSEGFV